MFTKYLPEKKLLPLKNINKKIYSTGKPWGPHAYFLKSFDRSWLTQQLLFNKSLQNIYQKKVIDIEK